MLSAHRADLTINDPWKIFMQTRNEVRFMKNSEGKGALGCVFSLLLLFVGVFVGIKVVPLHYSASSLETDVKTEVSRAGANFLDDEVLIKDIMQLAKKNEIRLAREDIKVERLAGQVNVKIHWDVPVDFLVLQHTLAFNIEASSYIGKL